MKRLLSIAGLVLMSVCVAFGATVQSVSSTNSLKLLNPNTANTNTLAVGDTAGAIGDGTASIWTYDRGSSVPEDSHHIKPLLYSGRWVRNLTGGTNTTSILTNVTVLNSTNYTIIGRTNITVTVVVSGTNVSFVLDSSGDNLWTNIAGAYSPAQAETSMLTTNLTSFQTLTVGGALIHSAASVNLGIGTNNLSPFQIGSWTLVSPTNDASQVVVRLASGNGLGQILYIENYGFGSGGFTMFDNDLLWDGSGGHLRLSGDWVPTEPGECILLKNNGLDWSEVSRHNPSLGGGDNLWEMNGNDMRTVPFAPDSVAIRFHNENNFLVTSNGWTVTGPGSASGNNAQVFVDDDNSSFRASVGGSSIALNSMLPDNALAPANYTFQGTAAGVANPLWNFLPIINEASVDTSAYTLDTFTNLLTKFILRLQNHGSNQLSFGPDPRITFGASNFVFKSATDLIYSNSVVSGNGPNITIKDGNNNAASLKLSGNAAQVEGGNVVDLLTGGKSVRWTGTILSPIVANADFGQLGGGFYPIANSYQHGTWYNYGFEDITTGGTNYDRMAVVFPGTNSTIQLLSQSSGIAGAPRPFEINRNLGATLTVGDTTFVDLFQASQTNALAGDLTFLYATNGLDLVEFTHVRTIYNPRATNCTVNLPSGWHKGTGAGASFVVTNGTISKLYVNSMGPTSSAALQTNCLATVSFFP